MNRRRLILAAGAFAATPLLRAQAPRRIAWIGMSNRENGQPYVDAFTAKMAELGFAGGRDYTIEFRYAEGRVDRLPALVGELLALKPDLAIASTSPVAAAFKQQTSTVPVVFVTVVEPDVQGFVASLARPGGNMTGVAFRGEAMEAKLREMIRETLPAARRVAALTIEGDRALDRFLAGARARFKASGFEVEFFTVRDAKDFDQAFAKLSARKTDVIYMPTAAFFVSQAPRLGELALRAKLPMVGSRRAFAAAGGLFSYDNDLKDDFRGAATFAARIFKGARPSDLPVEHPDRFHLAVNLRTAKALGIKIPQSVLLRADEVIE